MHKRVTLQPAFILHLRPYRDTSAIVDFLTLKYGRIAGVVRGIRSPKARNRGMAQPFIPLLISWVGNGDLVTINSFESNGACFLLQQQNLLYGLYVNELIVRCIPRWDAYPQLYSSYHQLLQQLLNNSHAECYLRQFEQQLLHELGYSFAWEYEAHTNLKIDPNAYYRLDLEQGFIRCSSSSNGYSGRVLLNWHQGIIDSPQAMAIVKHILEIALQQVLEHKTVNSRVWVS